MLETTASAIAYRDEEGQSVFPIPFPFLETTHIRAHLADADGKRRALAAGADYVVNRMSEGNGELVLLGPPLARGECLCIARLAPLTQELPLREYGEGFLQATEEALDKLTMIAQQLQRGLDVCLDALADPAFSAAPTNREPSPEDGAAGDILSRDANGSGRWKGPAHIANILPLMTESQKGVARLAVGAGLELDAGGALRIAADCLVSKANVEGRLGGLDARVESLASRLEALGNVSSRLDGSTATILALGERIDAMGAMASADDAPANGKAYVRQNKGWRELAPGCGEPGKGATQEQAAASAPLVSGAVDAAPEPFPAPADPEAGAARSSAQRVYLTACGTYHAEGCRHTRAPGDWLTPAEAAGTGRKCKPCSRCRPGALEA